jgi:nitrogen fixation NifU-like protein
MAHSEVFKDHIANPRNAGEVEDADVVVEESNPICGDRLRLSLRVRDGRIETAKYLAYGCPPTLVCGSVLTEMIKGKPLAEAEAITRKGLVQVVGGLPSRKHHAAALAVECLHSALHQLTSIEVKPV